MSLATSISFGLAATILAVSATSAFAGAAVATAEARLLDSPSAGARIVATVAPGAKLGVLWCGMQGQWCLVSYHARQGFVGAAGLKLVGGQLAVGSQDIAGNGGGGDGNNATPVGPHLVIHPVSGGLASLAGKGGGTGSASLAAIARPLPAKP